MVRRQQEGRIGRRGRCFSEQLIEPRQVLLRLRRFRRPGMHRVVGRMDVEAAQIAAILEQIDRDRQQPIIDLATVDIGRGTEALHPLEAKALPP